MADETNDSGETYEIGVETTGVEAAQQALAALGVGMEEVESEVVPDVVEREGSGSSPQDVQATEATDNTAADPIAPEESAQNTVDLSPILDELHNQTRILERIADMLENRPVTTVPTY